MVKTLILRKKMRTMIYVSSIPSIKLVAKRMPTSIMEQGPIVYSAVSISMASSVTVHMTNHITHTMNHITHTTNHIMHTMNYIVTSTQRTPLVYIMLSETRELVVFNVGGNCSDHFTYSCLSVRFVVGLERTSCSSNDECPDSPYGLE